MGFIDHGTGGSGEPVAALLRPEEGGLQHRRRPHHRHPTRPGPAAEEAPLRTRHPDPHRLRRRHARFPGLARPAGPLAVLLGRDDRHRRHPPGRAAGPGQRMDAAVEPDGELRDGAWVAELAGDVLAGWPTGTRLIVRKERPHPGAQLRFTDADGLRLTCLHPGRPRHWPAQPPSPRRRAEPHLAGERPARTELPRLDADARSDRHRPTVGVPTPTTSPVLRRRPDRHHRPPPTPLFRRPLALDRPHHQRDRTSPTPPEPRLTSDSALPLNQHLAQEKWNSGAHPTRQPGRSHARAPKYPPCQQQKVPSAS